MAQSKKQDDNTIVIDLDDTYGTTTTYMSDDTWVTNDGTFTISLDDDTINISDLNISNTTAGWHNDFDSAWKNSYVDISEVEEMCKEYPAIERAWRNFKTVYDLTYEDYKSKKDDDLPF
jgi:hypothetical protein